MVIVARFTTQDAQRYARAFASKNNNSQKRQITESQDRKDNKSKESQNNQPVKVNLEAEDTDPRLPAENAQLRSQNQNQDDITGTDMTLRPCAKGEHQRRVAGEPDCLGTFPLFPRISDGGEGSTVERTRDIRQGIGDSQLNDAGRRAITISTILAGSGVKMKAGTASSDVPFAQEQLCTSGLEELMEEFTEELRVGSVGQQKENIVDLSPVIITATTSELREIDTGPDLDLGALDQMHDLDDFNGIMDEINLTTIDDAEGINSPEPGRDQSSYLPDSSWGPIFGTTMWNNIAMGTITDFVVGHENLAGLLPTRSGEKPPDVQHLVGSLPPSLQEERPLLVDPLSPSHQEEPCAPTRALDASNIENYNNNYHFSIVPSVTIDAIAGTDVKKKDDIVIVATEGDTHGKIVGYNCGYYYDCDYWDEYDIRDENMEIESGTRMPSASYLSPCKALLRAGDFVFTGQPPGG